MNNQHLYLGKAGHLAIMSEFLIRGYNVAIPEVDIGDDIFVVQDETGSLWRIQVKTATAKIKSDDSFDAQFYVPFKQLQTFVQPQLIYIFLARLDWQSKWAQPIIVKQTDLLDYLQNSHSKAFNTPTPPEALNLRFNYQSNRVTCKKLDLTKHWGNFDDFPALF